MSELSPLIAGVLEGGGEVVLRVTGTSMLPMLRHRRDRVCLVRPPEAPLGKYDLPLFVRPDGRHILHRIAAKKQRGYVTIGDNQCVSEYPVLPPQIVAVAKGFYRDDKYVSCEDAGYRIYSRIWVFLFPLRRFCQKGKRLLAKVVASVSRGTRERTIGLT